MSALLVAPYNDSMRLGQGYNSFLQIPCLSNAVTIEDKLTTLKSDGEGTSQTVSYSASLAQKLSDVVRAMNISAGSSIRTGSVTISGGGTTVDETKFAQSDLNVVISVKVVNQTRTLREEATFNRPLDEIDATEFHERYGDAFVSGFIEGGDLHGIVSVKILDARRKADITSKLTGKFNGGANEWMPDRVDGLREIMQQTEATVTVNWSGGGSIKSPGEEWTIESLLRAAGDFPDAVAKCPQRTWAILTRYDTLASFHSWTYSIAPIIRVKRYERVQRTTSELLDVFMEYRANLHIINAAIRHLDQFEASPRPDKVPLNLEDLIKNRKELRGIMNSIVEIVETINRDPEKEAAKAEYNIPAPELWRARLPYRKSNQDSSAEETMRSLIAGLPIVQDSSSEEPKIAPMFTARLQNGATQEIKASSTDGEVFTPQMLAEIDRRVAEERQKHAAEGEVPKMQRELEEAQTKLSKAEEELVQLKNPPPDPPTNPKSGYTCPSWASTDGTFAVQSTVRFNTPCPTAPRIITGLTKIKPSQPSGTSAWLAASVYPRDVNKERFFAVHQSFMHCKIEDMAMSWMALPGPNYNLEFGIYHCGSASNEGVYMDHSGHMRGEQWQGLRARVDFTSKFTKPPTVACWLAEVHTLSHCNSIGCQRLVNETTTSGTVLTIQKWQDWAFHGNRVAWLAMDSEDLRMQTGAVEWYDAACDSKSGYVKFEHPMGRTPEVFFALSYVHVGAKETLQIAGGVTNVTSEGFNYTITSLNKSWLHACKYTWIAMI